MNGVEQPLRYVKYAKAKVKAKRLHGHKITVQLRVTYPVCSILDYHVKKWYSILTHLPNRWKNIYE